MLILIQGWRLNRRVKQCLQLPAPSAAPVIIAVSLGLIIGYKVSGGEVSLARFDTVGILALAALLTTQFLTEWSGGPQKMISVPVPYDRCGGNCSAWPALTPALKMDSYCASDPGQRSGQ